MTTLTVTVKTVHGAAVGADNPLPPLRTEKDVHDIQTGPGVPAEMQEQMRYGRRRNPLPYTMQDGYTREKGPFTLKALILENEFLKAVVLPEYGGRLWSLYDKERRRDLIYENPVFQPANLAIRNAWFSGGVEWNIGLRGHSPFTCSDVFAARVQGDGDLPILRLYEYERIRQVPYAMDLLLPHDSRVLLVFARIVNPHDAAVPMYWWSNIAYPEDPGTRIVVPAEQAFRFGYSHQGLALKDVPQIDGVDVTYSTNLGHSADFFFYVPPERRKWIAALDRDGVGLFQTSTDRLQGRKLFVWGSGPGGAAWQRFLSVPGRPYLEIQAGLARTQMEHLPMPPRTEWNWLEAYGCAEADPAAVHGTSWQAAVTAVDGAVEQALPRSRLEELHSWAVEASRAPVSDVLYQGSGWGRLEGEYRVRTGMPAAWGSEVDFETELGPAQSQWLELLEHGTFPEPDPLAAPVGYEVEEKWQALLQAYVSRQPRNWYALLHLGLMYFEQVDTAAAARTWTRSVEAARNPWALRNLGVLAGLEGDAAAAAEYYREAQKLVGTCTPLTIELAEALLSADLAEEWLHVYEGLPAEARTVGRLEMLYARGLLGAGRLDEALSIVQRGTEMTDLREGENSLTDLWYRIHERRVVDRGEVFNGDLSEYVRRNFPPPAHIDFRMRTD
jgi:tetratricopeptide (TPR) repeat protein